MEHVNYQSLIEKSPIGFALNKIICNDEGIPYDYEIIEVNDAFEKITGWKAKDSEGKRLSQIMTNLSDQGRDLIRSYGEVALGGASIEFEQYLNNLDRWFKVNVFSPQIGYFVTWFSEITEEKRDLDEKNILLAAINDIILELDDSFIFTNIVHCKEELLFLPREQVIGRNIRQLFSGDLAEKIEENLQQAMITGQKQSLQYELPVSESSSWFEAEIFIRESSPGNKRIIVSIKDITTRKKVEEELLYKTEELKRFFDINPDLLCIADMEGNFISVNSSWERMLGYPANELEKSRFLDFVHPDDLESTLDALSQLNRNQQIFNFVNRYRCKDGTYRFIEWCSQPYDKLIYAAARDITERKTAENKIVYLSFHDQLTGLYNRRYYEDELKRLNTEANLPLSLIMADVNGLKLANDAFGHMAGDKLLIAASELMKQVCPPNGFAARIGGDEFILVLPGTDKDKALEYIETLTKASVRKKAGILRLSVSAGMATKKSAGEDITDTFKKAEENMYNVKLSESPKWKIMTIKRIMDTLYRKQPCEKRHSEEVCRLCELMGAQLELTQEQLDNLRIAARLHDIGKISLSPKLLNKLTGLSGTDRLALEKHVVTGFQILNSINENFNISRIVLHHHERYDGTGYPDGLMGEEIPLKSRIIAITEAYDAMVNEHPYRKATGKQEALEEIADKAGTQFDPELAGLFLKVMQAWEQEKDNKQIIGTDK